MNNTEQENNINREQNTNAQSDSQVLVDNEKNQDQNLNVNQVRNLSNPTIEVDEEFLEEVLRAQEEALEKERLQKQLGIPPQNNQMTKTIRFFIWVMSFMLVFSMFAFFFQMYSIPAIEFIQTSTKLSKHEDIKLYKKAVVEVSTGESKGTGFAITEDGYIVTNSHVIDDGFQLTVIFPEEGLMKANIIADYPEIDLAILKVDRTNLPHLKLAPNFEPNFQKVTFIGNPLSFTGIANEGMVLGETISNLSVPVGYLKAPVYKGNSGSPVIQDGQVIGIIYATRKDDLHGKVGLFIPIDALNEKLSSISIQ